MHPLLIILFIFIGYLIITIASMPLIKRWLENNKEFTPVDAQDVLNFSPLWPFILLFYLTTLIMPAIDHFEIDLTKIVDKWLFKDKK